MSVAAGDRFGGFQIVSRIGAGGMGEVYRARDTSLGRDVAIKILPPDVMADPERRARFEREARVLASLNHPNIATIHGVEERDGVRALVMELVEGATLASRLAGGGALPVAEAIEIATQSAAALSAAHAAQIVHRDFKPANVMVRRDGYVKVLDFGLATAPASVDSLTATRDMGHTNPGTVMGTVQYMAPEQARGLAADQRADIFSLGAVLYEMIAGAPAFRGATPHEVAAAVLHEEPAPLGRLPGVSPALERVVTKMLRKDREQRYQDIRDVLVDLKALRAPAPTGRARRYAIVAAAAMLVAGVGYVASSRSPVVAALDAVAVLPLNYSGPTGDLEYLVDGLTESLITDLAQGTSLRVMSRSSSFRFKGRAVDAQAAGRELNVDAVLAGRIEPRGDRLAISLELIAVADGRQLWGHQYNEASNDLLQLQVAVSRDVVGALQQRSTGEDTRAEVQPTTSDPAAYRLYLQGRFYWKQLTDADVNKAIGYYLQAVQRDPGFALAYVGLAESYIYLGTDSVPPREALPKATAYAAKALSLKPDLADAHVAMGIIKLVYDWDWRGAEQELRNYNASSSRTVESFTCALHYADPLGRNDEALAALQSALSIDPLSLPANVEIGCAAYYGHHFEQAIRQFRGTLTLYPDHPFATFELGRALAQTHNYADAITTLQRVEASSGEWPPIVAELAYANAQAGNRAEAERLLAALIAQRSRRFVDPYLVAGVHVALGQPDRAFAALDDAVTERSSWLPWLKVEPKWEPLRGDRRYADLLRRVGLPL